MMRLTRSEAAVALFTITYIVVFTVWFLSIGNAEFIVYVVTMICLVGLIGLSARKADYPVAMLWALSIWGLAHMAGGGVPVRGAVLYNLVLIPLVETDAYVILKYDQLVHAYGFGVTAWLLRHLLIRHFPRTAGTATALIYPVIGAMGLGSLNEMIEFTAVLMVPETNVGGYYNTALDLVFNAAGAVMAMGIAALAERRAV